MSYETTLPVGTTRTRWKPRLEEVSGLTEGKDFHVVFDYPKGLYPAAISMATQHNFRLKDYIAPTTHPETLNFHIHGNPVNQIVFELTPVTGGGGACK